MKLMNKALAYDSIPETDKEFITTKEVFHQYTQDKQVALLTSMPIEDAVIILGECSVVHVQKLIAELDIIGEDVRARHFAHQLGIILSEVEPHKGYLNTGVLAHVQQRIGWIIGLALLGIVSGLIIASYEDTLSQLMLLAIYMPVIAAAGGNTGAQAATLVIRALATGELKKRQWLSVLWKEARVALIIGFVIALVIIGRILFFSDGMSTGGFNLELIACAVAAALFIQITISTTLGGVLPIIARACKLDPAVLVSPLLASIVDISGMWIYFSIVNTFLGIS
ncbi:magnesium transporter [Shewanella sp. TC10]|uniref:magnesium transporter n=1 Tax=Shewanella sp. TC10 TaxID=1419739 RepID=UPI00129E475F|nr:magnesium transporter [Shewanella sp. TC10]